LANDQQVIDPPRRALSLDGLITGRRSVRRLRPDRVPRWAIEAILEAGRWAPSPHGTQPWRFAVVTQAATKARLAGAMADSWRHNLAMDGQSPETIAARLEGSRRRIVEAPALIMVSLYLADLDRYPDAERQAAETTMAIHSLGACVQNMLLKTYELGLDAGWMCAPLFCPDIARDALGLPASHLPHALLPVGYAAADPKRRPRRPLAELVSYWDE
jgi:F420 biosynthesis protein FbiB-like protein